MTVLPLLRPRLIMVFTSSLSAAYCAAHSRPYPSSPDLFAIPQTHVNPVGDEELSRPVRGGQVDLSVSSHVGTLGLLPSPAAQLPGLLPGSRPHAFFGCIRAKYSFYL